MKNSFWRAAVALVLGAVLSLTRRFSTLSLILAADPYSFSFLEPSILTTAGAFAIPPFQVNGLTFTQATFNQSGGTECFQFGTAGASLSATPLSCSLSAFAPDGGWQSLFFGANTLGTYTAFNAASEGSAPAGPNQLTIQDVPAFQYTFSNDGASPYSFSFLEPALLSTAGAFPIAPFQVNGLTFTQATFNQSGGTECFQFGTAGAGLSASPFSCSVGAFAPEGGWQSLFFGANAPGSYTAFNAASQGSAPAGPDRLVITATPEPSELGLVVIGVLGLAGFMRRRRRVLSGPR